MFIGTVQCEVELSKAHKAFNGYRFLLVEPEHEVEWEGAVVAVDTVEAQVGDMVIVALAPLGAGFDVPEDLPIDGAVVGIVASITTPAEERGEGDEEHADAGRARPDRGLRRDRPLGSGGRGLGDRPDRGERGGRPERPEGRPAFDRGPRGDRPEPPARTDRPERPEPAPPREDRGRPDRGDRGGRPDRHEGRDRGGRGDRGPRGDEGHGGEGFRGPRGLPAREAAVAWDQPGEAKGDDVSFTPPAPPPAAPPQRSEAPPPRGRPPVPAPAAAEVPARPETPRAEGAGRPPGKTEPAASGLDIVWDSGEGAGAGAPEEGSANVKRPTSRRRRR